MKIGIAGCPHAALNYQAALSALGFSVQVSLDPHDLKGWDALLLPGGGDIDPALYGCRSQGSHSPDTELDQKQLALLDLAVSQKCPVLGICKGMQLIQIYFGGALIQHLSGARSHQSLPDASGALQDQVHPTLAARDSVLFSLYGRRFPVCSAHHQGILIPAKKTTAIQFADDGVVEALQHDSLPILGLQWHPERMCFAHARPDTVDGSLILRYFFRRITGSPDAGRNTVGFSVGE